jgi:hypothetical protein
MSATVWIRFEGFPQGLCVGSSVPRVAMTKGGGPLGGGAIRLPLGRSLEGIRVILVEPMISSFFFKWH